MEWFLIALVAFGLAVVARPIATSLAAEVIPFGLTSSAAWNILWGFLEAFVCVGFIVGLLIFSRRHFSRASHRLQQLDKNVFGIYIIHVFIVVGIQQALVDLALPASVKFLIAAVSGLLISYINVVLLRLIPWLRRII
jgi:glucan biosynthesis protein C